MITMDFLDLAWATSGPRATCGPPIAYENELLKPIFSQRSNLIGSYGSAFTGPHEKFGFKCGLQAKRVAHPCPRPSPRTPWRFPDPG